MARRKRAAALGELVAAEALEWLGTPFLWGQSVKGRGCDCKGLVAGVLRSLDRPESGSFYASFANYRADRPVPAALLLEGFAKLFDRAAEIDVGDVLLLKHGGRPGHMAIFVGNGRAVHAYPGIRASVKERGIDVLFHKFPLHSVWRLRENP